MKITKFNSDFMLSRIINTDSAVHVGCMYLEADGIVGYHQAGVSQLLLILEGEGIVKGDNNKTEHVKKVMQYSGKKENGMKLYRKQV